MITDCSKIKAEDAKNIIFTKNQDDHNKKKKG